MTVRTVEPSFAPGVPEPGAGRDAHSEGLHPPDYTKATRLTPAQRKRALKRINRARTPKVYGRDDWAYVVCEGCGWVGFDVHARHDPDVTPCPKCGCVYARYAIDY